MTLQKRFGTDVLITGWSHSPFGKLHEWDLESLITSVASEAIEAAGLLPRDIDAIYLGHFNPGLLPLAFASSLVLQTSDDLFGIPATRVENACASGSAAVHHGVTSILAGTARNVLVVGAEKMSHASAEVVGAGLLGGDYELAGHESTTGFAGLFADVADEYSARYGDCSDTLGLIAAKSHRNALANPYAQIRKDLGEEFCQTVSERNPIVASPLRRTDCSPVSDGAAALVLTSQPTDGAITSPVRIVGIGQSSDFLPSSKRDPLEFRASDLAWRRALEMADVGLVDLSLIELHDCFTIAELNLYEVFGLAPRGAGRRLIEDGSVARDGRIPVNPSGGLKSKGHPIGATGVSQHVLAAMQLTNTAGEMQVPDATCAAVHNMGGLAVANYVSVLRPCE